MFRELQQLRQSEELTVGFPVDTIKRVVRLASIFIK